LESVRGKDVYILQTATKKPDTDIMELFLLCQAAKLSFAKSIHVVMPHFPYARQDRVAQPREPISAKLIAHLLEESGADHVMTLDLHSSQIQGFFSIPVDALSADSIFAKYFNNKNLKNAVVISPDAGGAKRAKKFADLIGADLAIIHKSRPQHQKSEVIELVGEVKNRPCIIFDDIIDTGGTLIAAKNALMAHGANPDIYVTATHGIFSGNACDNFKKVGFKEIVVTDSLPIEENVISGLKILPIAPMLAEVIQHVEKGESVTESYEKN
jgi:ribose-phosphate pyrophosphokinase